VVARDADIEATIEVVRAGARHCGFEFPASSGARMPS
jgi:hypothetical protein